ncbi:diguanylate cyclase [Mycobacterium yunnanensis]|uniref:Diguanylate cyclase n=1 Tax=Mycobacterium yunnanensis TaxID=368477 RepID=A0A9X3C0E7_9MYCO|nr:diguanylate cyclase [Mycobacterium yunnanensis]
MADIDESKAINDSHGHAVGDVVIVAAAQLLTDHFGQRAAVARIGGEAFVVCDYTLLHRIIETTPTAAAVAIGTSGRRRFASRRPVVVRSRYLRAATGG